MPTDLKRFREDAVKKAMGNLPEEHDPSSFADAGDLRSEEAGRFGHMLDEARKTPELPEEKPKAPEPELYRYDLQNQLSDEALRAGMEMYGLGPSYLKRLRESAGRTYWTDPLAEGEEEPGRDTGKDWTHEDSRSRVDEVAANAGWDSSSRDALHGLYDIASEVYGDQPLDIVDFSSETAEADGMTLPREIVFSDADGNKLSVEWPSSKVTLGVEE